MPDIEAIIEAILRARLGDTYDHMPKLDLWREKQSVLEMLIPAIGTIEEIKADAWDEGVKAQDEYLLKAFVGTSESGEPVNPYRTGIA